MAKSRKRRSPYVFIMWLDPDVKFVSINSLFKRPVDKIFYFTYKMTMHDQMTIVVTC